VEQKGLYYAMWRQQIGERDIRKFQPKPADVENEEVEEEPVVE